MKIGTKKIKLRNGIILELRSAGVGDAKAMLDHLIIAHDESYQNLNSSGAYWKKVSVEEEEKILLNFEASSNKFMLVATDKNRIVGTLGIFGNDKEFNRHSASLGISIQKSWQNTGLGTEMMAYALENCRVGSLHRIDLTVRTYNASGIALYEKFGFRRTGILKEVALIDGKFVDEYGYELIL